MLYAQIGATDAEISQAKVSTKIRVRRRKSQPADLRSRSARISMHAGSTVHRRSSCSPVEFVAPGARRRGGRGRSGGGGGAGDEEAAGGGEGRRPTTRWPRAELASAGNGAAAAGFDGGGARAPGAGEDEAGRRRGLWPERRRGGPAPGLTGRREWRR